MRKFDFTLVMTAAVDVNGMKGISAESMAGREDQYIRTLKFYVGQTCVRRILFVENSNWDLTRIKHEVNSDKVEYISLNANSYPREWGKGYGEMYIMDRAVDRLVERDGGGVFVKVTGRFPILNIQTMCDEFSHREALALAVDVVEHNLYKMLGLKWSASGCRTIIYACDCAFYKSNLYGRYREIPTTFWGAEGLMRDVWEKNRAKSGVYARFRHEPRISGFAGAMNHAWITANNHDSTLACFKRIVRQLCRWGLPGLWL